MRHASLSSRCSPPRRRAMWTLSRPSQRSRHRPCLLHQWWKARMPHRSHQPRPSPRQPPCHRYRPVLQRRRSQPVRWPTLPSLTAKSRRCRSRCLSPLGARFTSAPSRICAGGVIRPLRPTPPSPRRPKRPRTCACGDSWWPRTLTARERQRCTSACYAGGGTPGWTSFVVRSSKPTVASS